VRNCAKFCTKSFRERRVPAQFQLPHFNGEQRKTCWVHNFGRSISVLPVLKSYMVDKSVSFTKLSRNSLTCYAGAKFTKFCPFFRNRI